MALPGIGGWLMADAKEKKLEKQNAQLKAQVSDLQGLNNKPGWSGMSGYTRTALKLYADQNGIADTGKLNAEDLHNAGWLTGGDSRARSGLPLGAGPYNIITRNRLLFSQLTPGQVFGAAKWVVAALEGLGWDHLQAMSIGTVYRPSDDERARRVFLKPYGGIIARWIDEFETPADFAAELVHLLNNKDVAHS